MNKDDPELLRIADAARFLGVNRRTIYRRIWNGDLPASKVGGLYFIRKEDLEGLLIRGRTKPTQKVSEEPPTLKCNACFRTLESDDQIAEICAAEGCEGLICDRCWSEDVRHCVKHIPDRVQKWEAASSAYQRGELPILVKGSSARLQEMNFINRIQSRIQKINTLIHPITEEVLTVEDWEEHCESGDERAQVMKLLGKMVLDKETTAQVPLNPFVRWEIPKAKRQQGSPLRIYIQVLSRTAEMLRDGFDTLPLPEEELTRRLIQIGEESNADRVVTLLVLASTTGWDTSARNAVQSEAHSNPNLLIYLFDLQSGELVYNAKDDLMRGYIELFAPALPEEEIEEVIAAIEKELLTHDSLSLQYAADTMPFSKTLIRKAFEKLAASSEYVLTEVPEIGTAIVQV